MATPVLLSQHSSNPLEVGSSDARNRAYQEQYLAAQARRSAHSVSSDDPIHGYNVSDVQKYHNHLSHVLPTFSVSKHASNNLVDLDEDMESDDEPVVIDDADHGDGDAGESDPDVRGDMDEEMTIHLKSCEEREEIEEEIADLEDAVPQLTTDYKIVDRLGTGTFSSVYKAIDLWYHEKWDNTAWHGNHPPSSSAYYQSAPRPKDSRVFVAIKRIYVTSSPERIKNEISIMEDCRGCRHISQLITAFRNNDQVVAIMPYHRNEDFRDFFRMLPISGIKAYFRCMFRALRDIHAREVIHRDVKPANFLYDPRTGIGTLCDFGLASRMDVPSPSHGACLHTPPTSDFPHGRIRGPNEYSYDDVKKMQKEARLKSTLPAEKVGYPDKDPRPISKANRAGTRGFRAPEVLFKCAEQTGAIDVWAAGMILCFFLTGKFPLFQSGDDIEALMEIAAVIGRRKMEKVATLHSRTFATNVPSVTQDGITWRDFIKRQNPSLYEPREPDPKYYPYNSLLSQYHHHSQRPADEHPPSSSSPPPPELLRFSLPSHPLALTSKAAHAADIDNALDLLEKLMHPESVKRVTPRDALYHPFLRGGDGEHDEAAEDDEFVPNRFGEGICGEWHFRDDVTESPCVKVAVACECGRGCGTEGYDEVMTLVAGQGISIGRQPCEFHQTGFAC